MTFPFLLPCKRRGISPAERDYPQQIISSPTSFGMQSREGEREKSSQ